MSPSSEFTCGTGKASEIISYQWGTPRPAGLWDHWRDETQILEAPWDPYGNMSLDTEAECYTLTSTHMPSASYQDQTG